MVGLREVYVGPVDAQPARPAGARDVAVLYVGDCGAHVLLLGCRQDGPGDGPESADRAAQSDLGTFPEVAHAVHQEPERPGRFGEADVVGCGREAHDTESGVSRHGNMSAW